MDPYLFSRPIHRWLEFSNAFYRQVTLRRSVHMVFTLKEGTGKDDDQKDGEVEQVQVELFLING